MIQSASRTLMVPILASLCGLTITVSAGRRRAGGNVNRSAAFADTLRAQCRHPRLMIVTVLPRIGSSLRNRASIVRLGKATLLSFNALSRMVQKSMSKPIWRLIMVPISVT